MKAFHALCIVALAASPAVAADLPNRAAPPVFVPPVVPYTWTGCYVGGFGAVDVAHVEDTSTGSRSNSFASTTTSRATLPSTTTATSARATIGTRPFIRRVPGGFATGNVITTRTTTTTVTRTPVRTTTTVTRGVGTRAQSAASYGRTFVGGDGGGRVGCNYQTGRLVLGAQLEGGYLGINGTTYDPGRRSTASAIGGGVYGAVTGRVGLAVFDRSLVYARGGVGYADLKASTYDTVLRFSESARFHHAIPLVGAGLEYKLTPHVSVTGEYTYMRPGCRTVGYAFATAAGSGTTTACLDKHMIAFGLNYYFGPEPVPVVARY